MTDTDPHSWRLPWTGGCRCGAVRFRVTQPPLLSSACHCTGCQSMSSSAFSLSLAVPSEGFAIVKGETVLGGLDQDVHHFCGRCMTWMLTRPTGMDWMVNLRPTMLDDHGWFAPFVETFTREALPWASTPAPHSFVTVPEMDGWQALTDAFSKKGARPES